MTALIQWRWNRWIIGVMYDEDDYPLTTAAPDEHELSINVLCLTLFLFWPKRAKMEVQE